MKKRISLIVGLAVAAALTLADAAFCADGSWGRVKGAGELVIGLDDAFPPMGFRREDGSLVGFDIDLAEAVGKRLGVKIVWQPTAWDGVIHSLNSKKFDCIWNGMTITPERAAKVSFTKPYVMDGQVAIVRFKETRFKDVADLGGAVIGAQKGSSALGAVAKMPKAPAEVKEYAANPKALLDLEAGRLDAGGIDNVVGRFAVANRLGKFKTGKGCLYINKLEDVDLPTLKALIAQSVAHLRATAD